MNKAPFKIDHQLEKHKNTFIINWLIGNICNFSCSYCPESLHNGDGWTDYRKIEFFSKRIIKQIPMDKRIYFEFTGGEVTMWKHFLQLCKVLKSQNREILVGFISNGSRTLNWWKKARPLVDKVILSYHIEGYTSADHFIEIVDYLRNDIEVHANIMMHYDKFDECLDLAKKLAKFDNISVTLQPLLVELNINQSISSKYSAQQLDIMNNQKALFFSHQKVALVVDDRGSTEIYYQDGSKELKSFASIAIEKTNRWKDWWCSAGKEQIIIDEKGDIYRGWCRTGGKIGKINSFNFKIPTKNIRCDKHVCACNFDISCSKRKF